MAAPAGDGEAGYRYGVVLLLVLALVVFLIVAPTATWSRAIGFGLEALALAVAVATSRVAVETRGRRALVVVLLGTALVIVIALQVISNAIVFALGGLVAAAIPVTLARGVLRLLRSRGVTIQAVAGALSIYLLVGLMFGFLVRFVGEVQGTQFFVQQHSVNTSSAVYYSFTVMTTTGFGDLTAATRVGRALAVLEMLLGQIYVVVVIGLLVGSYTGKRSNDTAREEA
jgi:Ion channel